MRLFIVMFFLGLPLIELYFFIEVGKEIGGLSTVLLTIVTAVVGLFIVRVQGFLTLQRAQQSMAQGEMPAIEMFEGVFLFIGGVCLFIPGFLTDTLGFLCLIPPLRRGMIFLFLRQSFVQAQTKQRDDLYQQHRIIEGEYSADDEEPKK